MSGARKAVRKQIADLLKIEYPDTDVLTSHPPNLTDLNEAITVHIGEGETTYEGLQRMTEAELVIGFHQVFDVDDSTDNNTSDALDDWSDPAVNLLESANLNITPTGFKYGDGESELASLFLFFSITFFA